VLLGGLCKMPDRPGSVRTPSVVRASFDLEQRASNASAPRASASTRAESLLKFEPGFSLLHRKTTTIPEDNDAMVSAPGRTTTLSTGMNLVTVMVGVGVLGFPKVFGDAGWFFGPLILLASAVSGMEIGFAIVEAITMCEDRMKAGERFSFRRLDKYEDMVEVAFGRVGKDVASVLLNTFMLLICGAFMILIGSSLQFLTHSVLPYRAWVLLSTVLFARLCLMKDMEVISRLSMVGVAASLIYVLAISQAGLEAGWLNRGKPDFQTRDVPEHAMDIGIVLSVMFLGFGYQIVTPTVRSEMAVPEEMPQAISGAVIVVTFVYGAVGVVGYWGWGNAVGGNVLDSMVDSEGNHMLAGIVLSLAVIANLFVTFPILMNVVSVALEARCCGGQYSPPLRMGLLAAAVVVGLFSPFFLQVLTLIGATIGMVNLAFLPLLVYWKLALSSGRQPATMVYIKHSIILVLGCIALIFGTYVAVLDLIKAMESPKANPIKNFWEPM